jgi:hypothetical protein
VTGPWLHADGSPISRLLVQAFHRRVGGSCHSESKPRHERPGRVRHRLSAARRHQQDRSVRAVPTTTSRAVVAVSSIVGWRRENATLDLTVTNERFRVTSRVRESHRRAEATPRWRQRRDRRRQRSSRCSCTTPASRSETVIEAWIASEAPGLAYGRRTRIAVCPRAESREHGRHMPRLLQTFVGPGLRRSHQVRVRRGRT